jgi:hypothetical protein
MQEFQVIPTVLFSRLSVVVVLPSQRIFGSRRILPSPGSRARGRTGYSGSTPTPAVFREVPGQLIATHLMVRSRIWLSTPRPYPSRPASWSPCSGSSDWLPGAGGSELANELRAENRGKDTSPNSTTADALKSQPRVIEGRVASAQGVLPARPNASGEKRGIFSEE